MLSKQDITALFSLAYYEASQLENCDMRLVADSLETIRSKMTTGNPYQIWEQMPLDKTKFPSDELIGVLVRLRNSFFILLHEKQSSEINNAFKSDPQQAFEVWIRAFAEAAVFYQEESLDKLIKHVGLWDNAPNNPLARYQKIVNLIQDERWPDTFSIYESIGDDTRHSPETRVAAYVCLVEIIIYFYPDVTQAKTYLNKADQLLPEYFLTRRAWGEYHLVINETQKARDILLQAISLKPEDYSSFNFIGDCFKAEGNVDGAESWYKDALRKNFLQSESYIRLIDLYADKRWLAQKQSQLNQSFEEVVRLQKLVLASGNGVGAEDQTSDFNTSALHKVYRHMGSGWYANGDLPKAEAWYKKAKETLPHLTSSIIDIAYLRIYQNDMPSALEYLSTALSMDKTNFETHWAFAYYYSQLQNKEEAIKSYDECLRLRPHWKDWVYNFLGNLYYGLREYHTAASYYQKSFEINDNNKVYKTNYALAVKGINEELLNNGNYAEAEKNLKAVVALTNDAADWTDLARLYKDWGASFTTAKNYLQAEEHYKKAIQILEANKLGTKESALELAQFYASRGDFKQAEIYTLKALNEDRQNIKYLDYLCYIYEQTYQNDKGIPYYEEMLRIDPKHSGAKNGLGIAYYVKKDYELAIKYYQEAIALKDDEPVYHENLGLVFEQQGKYEEAIICYQMALKLSPENSKIINLIGLMHYRMHDYAAAVEYYRRAISLDPENWIYFSNLGIAFRDAGKRVEAIEAQKKVVLLKPDDYLSWNELGVLFYEIGDTQEAIKYYRKAIEINPSDSIVHNNLTLAVEDEERGNQAKASV
jgi:tetratricopeptide (TPR) repeat protein